MNLVNALQNRNRHQCHQRRGAMLVLIAFMMIILLVMSAFAIDVAYMQLVRTELRTSTDAAARAASESLARTQSIAQARQAARDAANVNLVATEPLLLDDSDIVFGSAVPNGSGLFQFQPGANPTNAVRIVGGRTANSPSGPVGLFMAGGVFGRDSFEPELQSTTTAVTRDIALVLDRSGSMRSQNKIGDLKAAVNIFLDVLDATRNDERVSLATYATTGTKDVDMTSNLGIVRNAVQGLPAAGFTAIGQGLVLGSNSLEFDTNSRPFSDKAMVVLTDGRENRAPFVNEVLQSILDANHVVHTITFGAGADQDLMRNLANATGGTHQHAPNGAALRDAFETIARSLAVVLID